MGVKVGERGGGLSSVADENSLVEIAVISYLRRVGYNQVGLLGRVGRRVVELERGVDIASGHAGRGMG